MGCSSCAQRHSIKKKRQLNPLAKINVSLLKFAIDESGLPQEYLAKVRISVEKTLGMKLWNDIQKSLSSDGNA